MRLTAVARTWILILGAVLASSSTAFGNAFSVEVGQTKVMGVSRRIVGITVRHPNVVEVKRLKDGGGVTLEGKELGKTEIALRTVDGNEVEFVLHVTSVGAKVFSTSRDQEPHTGSSKPALTKGGEKKKKARSEPIPETEPEPTKIADSAVPPA